MTILSIMLSCMHMQLPLSKSVERKYHSMSVFQIGPHCLWLIVYGGFHTASTMIIELSKYNFSLPIAKIKCIDWGEPEQAIMKTSHIAGNDNV